MANFAINPTRFFPALTNNEDGGPHRRARRTVIVSGDIEKTHEDHAIATCDEVQNLSLAETMQFLEQISHYVEIHARKDVHMFAPHPHGIGIFQFGSVCERDTLVVCSCFGQLIQWNSHDTDLARVLVSVMVDDPLEVPSSLEIKHGRDLDG
ncbi:hypothetical protein EJB05_14676, partial [Eragrostis curvula]